MKWYKYDIRDLSNAEYEKWYLLMSVDKQQRVDRFHFMDDKKRTVAGEMLARKAIAEWCDVSKEEIQFDKAKHGKPFTVGLDVEFNISHSRDMVVCAVDDTAIGIDIEQIRPIDLTVAKRICTDAELRYVFGYIPTEKDFSYINDSVILTRFFEIWTFKEAYFKCSGTGIMDLQKLDVLNSVIQRQTFIFNDYLVSVCQEICLG